MSGYSMRIVLGIGTTLALATAVQAQPPPSGGNNPCANVSVTDFRAPGDERLRAEKRILVDGDRMPGAAFFPDARLNFAENLLRKRGSADAIVFKGEDKVSRRLSWDDLHALVSRLQQPRRSR